MRTAKPFSRYFGWIVAMCLILLNAPVLSHPMGQGAAVLDVSAERIVLELTVSLEQVLVASQREQPAKQVNHDLLRRHGDYLLRHIELSAGGYTLRGAVISEPQEPKAPLKYRLQYIVDKNFPLPTNLVLRQDVLRDINFAPGSPWEVSYRLQAFANGQPIAETLFTHQTPLQLQLGGGSIDANMHLDYAALGLTHILKGYDHLLFVGGLVLAVSDFAELCVIILLFTVAHSLTMSLAALDIFRLSPRLVEPVIAFSIVVVALQNVFWPKQSRGLLRYAIAFGFGLFHGMGFAGGLIENTLDISSKQIVWAILSFSIGVECGHLLVVTPTYGALAWVRNNTVLARRADAFRRFGSSLIGLGGFYYGYFSLGAQF